MNLAGMLQALEVGLEVFLEVGVNLSALLYKGDAISDTETVLEEKWAANALDLALHHDADAVAEHVRLVHVMSGQDNDAVLLVSLEHVPEVATGTQVHA